MNMLDLSELISILKTQQKCNVSPTLAIIKYGNSKDTLNYICSIQKKAQINNVKVIVYDFENVPDYNILSKFKEIQKMSDFILPVKPFPIEIKNIIICNIDPFKDVDNFGNFGIFESCTAEGVLYILKYFKVPSNSKITILGSNVGMDIHRVLMDNQYKPYICNSRTNNITNKIKHADVLISCTGVRNLITKDDVKKNSLILDVGLGDVSNNTSDVAFITPIRNGIGALTSEILFKHIFENFYK